MEEFEPCSRRTFNTQCCGIVAGVLDAFRSRRSARRPAYVSPTVDGIMAHTQRLLTAHPDVERVMQVRPRNRRSAHIGFTLFEQIHWYADATQSDLIDISHSQNEIYRVLRSLLADGRTFCRNFLNEGEFPSSIEHCLSCTRKVLGDLIGDEKEWTDTAKLTEVDWRSFQYQKKAGVYQSRTMKASPLGLTFAAPPLALTHNLRILPVEDTYLDHMSDWATEQGTAEDFNQWVIAARDTQMITRCLEEYRQNRRTILHGTMGLAHDLQNDVEESNKCGAEQISLLIVRTHAAAKSLAASPKRNIPVFYPLKPFPFGPAIPSILPR